ncbi:MULTISPECIES: AarF/ABC1/UbiB kinase family protein [Nocardia]|uniref:ABC1 kinase family protein n=1 Tax=Nocardia TaxID=1817 RepID=UPI0007E9EF5F|nr:MULTISPECIES: AarF/ABC1/UbiB kinase family protein [Nocardia]MBF6277526.1 AarF/ABC1/UbiB kinase family protein [Nocardia nova]OBA44999.1 ubiquinone biosynthesis protein [Nocardia sp. 852002-51101_SCH5132738]OBB32858.1 ubiquinone biosynthesis protein [Nocardia sp. 852002-51244_SCH5132740]OBF70845.1 ubiquinone biosynthesis protein [Mycobacterium sp. 852002-51759_SCH5129042]
MTAAATQTASGPGAGATPPQPVPALEKFGFAEFRRTAAIGTTIGSRVTRRVLREGLRPAKRRRAMADGTVDGFEALGPMFVKLGQLIASSPASFPDELADACLRCLDDVPPFPATDARAVIEADLGAPIDRLFREFDDEPLSAASVAQVHACVLADGRPAVLKVQRPDIARRMIVDLRAAYRLAGALTKRSENARIANAEGVVRDLYDTTVAELDFRNEARNQAQARADLAAFGDNTGVVVPEVYWEYCGPRVLCMERMSGMPLDRFDDIRAAHPDPELLIRRLVKAWVESVVVHGLFHGDVHAGNLWLLDDGRAAMLDFGIVGTMTPQWRAFVRALFHASAIDGDFRPVARALRELDLLDGDDGDDATIGRQLATALAPVLSDKLAKLDMGKVAARLVEFGKRRGASGPQQLLLMGKQLGYFERYAVALAPGWRLGQDLYLFRNIFPEEVAAKVAADGIELPTD